MSSSSYSPSEATDLITDEVAWLQGAFIGSLLCGIQITLSAVSFLAVLKQRMRRRLRIALLIYIFLLCALMTAGQQVSLVFVQIGFIQERDYPGGPNAYLSNRYTTPVDLASTSMFIFANWMMESLMVWRCKVVCCTGDRPAWPAVIFACVLLVGEYGSGILFFSQMLQGRYPITYALVYSGLSLLLNFTVTGIIARRLWLHRQRMVRQFGPGHGLYYISVATVLIESASLYTLFLILVIVFFCVGTAASNILQQAVAQVQGITSLLIIYRIARGKEWREDPGVTSTDWRGSTIAQAENDVVHLELVPESTQPGGQTPSMSGKHDETPISACSADGTIVQHEGV